MFVGPSNTGKSYLAILVYAMHRFFGRAGHSFSWLSESFYRKAHSQNQGFKTAFEEVAQQLSILLAKGQRDIAIPDQIIQEFRAESDSWGNALAHEIGRCFGVENAHALSRKGRGNVARIALQRQASDDGISSEHLLTLAKKAEFKTDISSEIPIQINVKNTKLLDEYVSRVDFLRTMEPEDSYRQAIFPFLMYIMGNLILPHVAGPLSLPAYYLPASRTGVMHAHRVVVSALIGSASKAGLHPAVQTPMLSGVLADFLETLIAIDPSSGRREKRKDFGSGIEETILGGSIRVDRSETIDYPHFTYQPEGWDNDLPLMNASSMVSELAPIVLYLRHMVKPGHVLIVEEPESHLHPAMQVELMRQLAVLVRAGIRVIVTTHSEWVLEELANIVRRSALPKHGENGDSHVALSSSQVGAWLFTPKRRPRGSEVEEIHLDDSGLYPSGFDDVAIALHNDWADITSRIGNGS